MAQLNCANCTGFAQQPQWIQSPSVMPIPTQDPWGNQLNSHQHLNRSNLSLNIPSGYMMHSAHQNMYPPPVFMNQRNLLANMYPQAYIEPHNQGFSQITNNFEHLQFRFLYRRRDGCTTSTISCYLSTGFAHGFASLKPPIRYAKT